MPENRPRSPAYLEQADQFYKLAFDVRDKDELARAMADWCQLNEAERSFALAHLLYLNLQAQALSARLLRETRDLMDELSDDLADVVDDALGPEDDDAELPAKDPAAPGKPGEAPTA